MPPTPCAICGQPSMFHETTLDGGAASVRHLCREHGQPSWIRAASECDARLPAALGILDDLRRMADEHRRLGDF